MSSIALIAFLAHQLKDKHITITHTRAALLSSGCVTTLDYPDEEREKEREREREREREGEKKEARAQKE